MKTDEDILDAVENLRKKQYSDIRRMNKFKWLKELWSCVPPGKRKMGRPRKT